MNLAKKDKSKSAFTEQVPIPNVPLLPTQAPYVVTKNNGFDALRSAPTLQWGAIWDTT